MKRKTMCEEDMVNSLVNKPRGQAASYATNSVMKISFQENAQDISVFAECYDDDLLYEVKEE